MKVLNNSLLKFSFFSFFKFSSSDMNSTMLHQQTLLLKVVARSTGEQNDLLVELLSMLFLKFESYSIISSNMYYFF